MASRIGDEIERLVGIMARLRAEGGCPWDRAQDPRSLRPYLLEECFEVLDELDRVAYGGPWQPYCEELGDLLFQIVFHAQLATELSEFDLGDVAEAISEKIVRRHPHVFPPEGSTEPKKVSGAEEVLSAWAKIKAAERAKKHGHEGSVLDGVPTAAPALLRAERLTEKASRIGFDWPSVEGAREKLDEELSELDEAARGGNREAIEHELGDVLFSVVNVARHLRTPPEDALRQAIVRFTRRFRQVEAGLREDGIPFGQASLEQMEAHWQKAKRAGDALPPPRALPRVSVGRLELGTRDLRPVAAFWRKIADVVGASVLASPPGALRLDVGGLQVRWIERGEPTAAAGLELTLSAPSAETVRAVAERLRRSEVDLDETEGGLRFVDPSGLAWRYAFEGPSAT